jgi:hypothetical protein
MKAASKHSVPTQPEKSARENADHEGAKAAEQNLDQLRFSLARKLAIFGNRKQWPACQLRACRRHRQCAAPGLECANPAPPRRVVSPEKDAAAMAHFQRALRRRLAALQAEGRG